MGRREKPIDPGAGPVQGFAFALRKLREEAGGPPYREMAKTAGYSIAALARAAAGETLPSLALTLAYVKACRGELAEWERRWQAVRDEEAAQPSETDVESADPPYRGLARFEPGDHMRFFGRTRLTDQLTALAGAHRCVVVLGPSGSGKSSLLRAGLIPRLQSTTNPQLRPAAIRILTPGPQPVRDHRKLFTPAENSGDLAGAEGPADTWLVVDQFEEVFTLCHDPAQRREFIDLVLSARRPGSRLRVVVGVRADFYARCLEYEGLAEVLGEASLPVGPMAPEELREVIVKPATTDGLIVERALTTRLIDEMKGEPGALPLLSHTLLEIWRRRRGRALTVEGYEAAGGLHGAITQTAESCFVQLSPAQAEAARGILLRLIAPGEGAPDTCRPVSRAELDLADAADRQAALDRLADARLVALDDGTVVLAHEALISAWPRLQKWVDDNRERLCRHRRLTDAARNWQNHRRDSGALLRGAELTEIENAFHAPEHYAELATLERHFLRACTASRVRSRRTRRAAIGIVGFAVVAALVAGMAAWQQNRTSEQRQAEATARRVAALAQSLRLSDPALAMRLSLAAWSLSKTPESRSALLGAMSQREQDAYRITRGDMARAFLSVDGRTVVREGLNSVQAWDVPTRRAGTPRRFRSGWVQDVSPDGRVAIVGSGREAHLRDLRTGKSLRLTLDRDQEAYFGASGRTAVGEGYEGGVRMWDLKRHRLVFAEDTAGHVMSSAVSPDDRFLAICTAAGAGFELWDTVKHRKLPVLRKDARVRQACRKQSLRFTPDSQGLAGRSPDGLQIWDLASGRVTSSVQHRGIQEFEFSPDGKFVAATDGREILLWRIKDPTKPVLRHPLTYETVRHLRFDVKSGVIRYIDAAYSYEPTVRALSYGPAMAEGWRKEPATQGVFTPDGRRLALKRRSGDLLWFEIRRASDGKRIARTPSLRCDEAANTMEGEDVCYATFALSPDGGTLAYGKTVLDDESGSPREPEKVTLWDITRRTRIRSLTAPARGEGGGMEGIVFSPDGQSLLAPQVHLNGVDLWNTSRGTKKQTASPPHYSNSLESERLDAISPGQIALHPRGHTLATAGRVFTLPPARATTRKLGMDTPLAYAFRPDGGQLAAGENRGRVVLWDGSGKHRLGSLAGTYRGGRPGITETVGALAYSPDGKTLAVGGKSGTLQLWDIPTRQPLGLPFRTPGDHIVALSFAADGRTFYAAGKRIALRAYAVDPRRVSASVCARAAGGPSRAEWRTYLPEVPYRKLC
ncbi:hypothetical protein GCM10010252_26840 [Streptomyces aureoverticillatus]|nr:hypothetical protein GCM10010252_26840 [Streptomyces aureoverticillatus]